YAKPSPERKNKFINLSPYDNAGKRYNNGHSGYGNYNNNHRNGGNGNSGYKRYNNNRNNIK
ncbi:MAG: hypothetical protein K2I68_02020, partial [Bacteroidales bacterium]|nr:hypothetical protein [Bacteroidales bacterium]